ncbi:MAG: FKBP-type peptidyl-prolyl cis-trans isomerase [Euryarchaeota archaeon]|nr:FKBP-type peptidyl-prolyl cis-trans isomerase [Euryarchaeota archaeon]
MVRNRQGLGWLGRIIAIALVAAVYFGAYAAFFAPRLPSPFTPPVAEDGDFVELDYVGRFPDTDRVFDTSKESVAKDNATYAKAASFAYRIGGRYEPLQFTMGCTPGPVCPLRSFQQSVLGMQVDETRRFTLTPEQAYGLKDPKLIEVRPLLEQVRVTETITTGEFQSRFVFFPVDGMIIQDRVWGWDVTVRVSGEAVTIRNSPAPGEIVTVAGKWSARIVSIDDAANEGAGEITVHHLLAARDVGGFVAEDLKGNFIVVALDPVAGTYTVDYNREVVGRTLAFEVTLRDLRKGRQ